MNNAKSSSTGETPFFLNYGTHPNTPMALNLPDGRLPTLDKVFTDMESTLERVKKLHTAAQDRQKTYADTRRIPHTFQTGDRVMLSTQNLTVKKGVKKLQPKFIGPFTILDSVGTSGNAMKLELPQSYRRIHPVFHVSLLRPYKENPDRRGLPIENPEMDNEDPTQYEVEAILAYKLQRAGKRKVHKYLIKWKGYDDTHNSWEPKQNIHPDLIRAYEESKQRIT
jgi:hypothetical protein